ncbi:MAG: hypothetical protein ACRD3L_15030 [Terriglobales bacterium]
MWTALVGLAAGLLGILLGQALSAVREHVEWVNEQKRLEYRQLIDQLFETMNVVIECRPNLREQNMPAINQAVKNLHRLLLDRLFIAEKLKKAGVIDDFLTVKKVIYYDPEEQAITPRELQYTTFNMMERENRLREKILQIAAADIVKLNFFGMPIDE